MKGKASASKRVNGNSEFNTSSIITPEQRQHMIAEAAYYRALQRGFQGGDPVADWLDAEQEVDRVLLQSPGQAAAGARNQATARRGTSEAQRAGDRR